MDFESIEPIRKIETIAVGHGIHELQNLKRLFGDANWRKLKGEAQIKLPMVIPDLLRYIGMKVMESVAES